MKYIIAAILLIPLPGFAEIYQCEQDGRKVFSQQPCGRDAKTVTLENGPRKIIIPEIADENYAEDFCQLASGAFDMVVAKGHNRGHRYSTGSQPSNAEIESFIRERIANYEEMARQGPEIDIMIERVSSILFNLASSKGAQSPTALRTLRNSCLNEAKRVLEKAKSQGKKATPGDRRVNT